MSVTPELSAAVTPLLEVIRSEFVRFVRASILSLLVICMSSIFLFGTSPDRSSRNSNHNNKRKRSSHDRSRSSFHAGGGDSILESRIRRQDAVTALATKRRSTSLPRKLDASFVALSPSKRDTLAAPSRLPLRTRSVDALSRLPLTRNAHHNVVLPGNGGRQQHHRSRLVMDLLYAASNMERVMFHNHNNNDGEDGPAPPPPRPPPRWRGRPPAFFFAPPRPGLRGHGVARRGDANHNNREPPQHHHPHRRPHDRFLPPDHLRLQLLMAREQAFMGPPLFPAENDAAPDADSPPSAVHTVLQRHLKPVQGNNPACTAFREKLDTDEKAQLLAEALEHNTVLQCLALHPSGWKDLGVIKAIAKNIRHHPALKEVHLYQSPSDGRGRRDNFVSQLAWDILIQAMHENQSIHHWGLHLDSKVPSSLEETVTDKLCHCIASCDHLQTLELVDEHGGWIPSSFSNSHNTSNNNNKVLPVGEPHRKLAAAIAAAQSSLHTLNLTKVENSFLEHLFQQVARVGTSAIQTLHIEFTSHAGTGGLESFLTMPSCQLKTIVLKHIQSFQRVHMDQLVGGLTKHNASVKNISFQDCSFHPEVVRPLQDLVRTRLDLESFQITRCNADPTMAVLTCFQNNHSQVQSITMGYSLGIEDRLGGDAIRSVLRYNSTLSSLNLTGSHRLGQVGLRHLARGLGKNSHLRKLDLSHCSVPHTSLALMIQHITGNPTTQLSSINLSHNHLGTQGVRLLVDDWLLHPECQLQELILNRCEIVPEAFRTLIEAISTHTTPLEVLELLECGRLTVNDLQAVAESLFRLGNLRVLKASCFKSPVHPIRPLPAHAAAPPPGNNNHNNNIINDGNNDLILGMNDEDEDSDDEDDSDTEDDAAVVAGAVEAVAHGLHNNNNNNHVDPAIAGSLRLLRETFLAGLIHNQALEHISLVNLLECVMKPKDAARVRAWMDFCGKRNLLQPLLQQTEIPLLQILTDIVRECRDPRTCTLNPTGQSLYYHTLRNRPDALDRVQRMLTVEAERLERNVPSEDEAVCIQDAAIST